jgi:hypothetical protein
VKSFPSTTMGTLLRHVEIPGFVLIGRQPRYPANTAILTVRIERFPQLSIDSAIYRMVFSVALRLQCTRVIQEAPCSELQCRTHQNR